MNLYRSVTLGAFGLLIVLLAAFHSPGEMSVDSIMALFEGAKGAAVGWGPTFMASTIVWLGGGTVGTSLLVGLVCLLTYACFLVLLLRNSVQSVPVWQVALAFVLSLNPIFMFYVGIVWKDVMLATVSLVAATLIFTARDHRGWIRYVLIGCAVIVCGMLVPIRQQGILIAAPIAAAAGWLAVSGKNHAKLANAATILVSVCAVLLCSVAFYEISAATVRPQPRGPVSVGIFTIQAYDIAGMIANANPNDPNTWSNAAANVQEQIKKNYSSERIDTIWHLEPVRKYFNGFSASQYTETWWNGIKHDPWAYIKSRAKAFAALLGLGSINGCVPAYWGVYGLPDQVKALGLRNEMDARALVVGHTAQSLYVTPVFRNWFYTLLLLFGTLIALLRTDGDAKMVTIAVAVAGWLYFLSFIPTTIACDVRYLYPVAVMATALCVFLLTDSNIIRVRSSK